MNENKLKQDFEDVLDSLSIQGKGVCEIEDNGKKSYYCTLYDFDDGGYSSEVSLWSEIGCKWKDETAIEENVVYSFCLERDQAYFNVTKREELRNILEKKYTGIFDSSCYDENCYKKQNLFISVYKGKTSEHKRIYFTYSFKKEECNIADELRIFLKFLKEKGIVSSEEFSKLGKDSDLNRYTEERSEMPFDTKTLWVTIKSQMESCGQQNLKFYNESVKYGFIQYVPYVCNDSEWAGTKCHYEFHKNRNNIEITFHCEGSFSFRNQLAKLILEHVEFSKMSCKWQKTEGGAIIFDNVKVENDMNSVAEKAVGIMVESVKKYGMTIQELITKSKDVIDMSENKIDDLKKLLENNHNIILHGAPGTGKTYLAKKIAEAMGCTENEIGFVQFHQSYDYTDFVEGLRPAKGENGKAEGFKHQNGVFKSFCRNAILKVEKNGVDNYDDSFQKVVDFLNENEIWDVPLISGKGTFKLALNSDSDGFVTMIPEGPGGSLVRDTTRFFNYNQCYKVYRGLPGVPKRGLDNYRKAIINQMKVQFGLKDYVEGDEIPQEKRQKYVFIIDEINRGEISKIFGELFFSIDPGYRGEKGRINTQYQNLVEDGDIFEKGFFVPENVYIIGTMNDIDRSVESMDFAMRRRFAFKEIKASDRIEMLKDVENGIGVYAEDAEKRMNALNDAIEKIPGLSSAYHIGPAYFLKLKNYMDESSPFNSLWEYHIEGVVKEYLRGIDPDGTHFDALKKAYEGKVQTENLTENAEV